MQLRSLLPSGAWHCFAICFVTGAFAIGNTSARPATIQRASIAAHRDSLPGQPAQPDSLRMLAAYTGTYLIPDDPDLDIILEEGKLYGIPKSGNKHLMVRTGQHQFYVPDKEILAQFEMDSYGQVIFLQLTKGGQSTTATKKK